MQPDLCNHTSKILLIRVEKLQSGSFPAEYLYWETNQRLLTWDESCCELPQKDTKKKREWLWARKEWLLLTGISVDAAAAETEPDGIFTFKNKKIWERQLKAFLSVDGTDVRQASLPQTTGKLRAYCQIAPKKNLCLLGIEEAEGLSSHLPRAFTWALFQMDVWQKSNGFLQIFHLGWGLWFFFFARILFLSNSLLITVTAGHTDTW